VVSREYLTWNSNSPLEGKGPYTPQQLHVMTKVVTCLSERKR
jgi:hypothetical protein